MYTGYNALSMALAMPPNGRVVACEIEEAYINIAKPFFKEVRGLSSQAEAPGSRTTKTTFHIGTGTSLANIRGPAICTELA